MTWVLTISALDLGIDNQYNYMASMCNFYAVTGGNLQLRVPTRAQIDPSNGDWKFGTIYRGADTLNAMINRVKGKKIVFGYSQGAQIASTWLRRFGYQSGGPSPDELSFLLIGNPERKYGKQPWTVKTTPDDTKYKIRDVTRKGDNWADYDPRRHPKNRYAAMFGVVHTDYWQADPYDPQAEIVAQVGNTTYVRIP